MLAKFDPRLFSGKWAPRSVWLQEALSRESRPPDEALRCATRADVCVVGGGLTGLWTAISLKQREPGMDVVVVEADICGGGASGRSGGFVMTWWSKFSTLQKLCGHEDALHMARRTESNVQEIGRFCDEHHIDAGFHQGGWVWAATNRSQIDAWKHTVDAIAATGAAPYQMLDRDQVAERTGSPVHVAGLYEPAAGIVQPALLARGLASVARDKGVRIYERTSVTEVGSGAGLSVVTTQGSVSASTVVLALNAWGGSIPQLKRALVIVGSDVIATEPIPDRLQQIGWARNLSISDSRRLVNYYRLSDDGRVVFGKGGGTLALGGRVGPSFHRPSSRAEEVRNQFRQIYPMLGDTPIAASWRGPIDYSVTGLPFFCRLNERADVIVGAGFSGNGIGPSYLAGQVLANMAIDGRDESVPEALTRSPTGQLPAEPFRYLGGLFVRAAVARKESAEDHGHRPGAVNRVIASLDPTSFVDRGPRDGGDPSTPSAAHGTAAPSAAAASAMSTIGQPRPIAAARARLATCRQSLSPGITMADGQGAPDSAPDARPSVARQQQKSNTED